MEFCARKLADTANFTTMPLHNTILRADGRPGHLALAGGPVGPPARCAATSNVKVGQTTYPVNRGRVWRGGEKGARTGTEWNERGAGTLSLVGMALLG